MKNKTTLLLSAFAAAALLAGCRTTQTNHVRRGIVETGASARTSARTSARARPAAQPRRTAPVAAPVAETPLVAQPQPVAARAQPVAVRPHPVAPVAPAADAEYPGAVDPSWPVPMWNTDSAAAAPAAATAHPAPAKPVAAPAATSAPVAAPSPAPAPAAASAAPAFESYKVKRGDVAGRIANSHGMTLKEFLETNGMTLEQANKLREGSTVKVWAGQEALKPGPAVRTPSHPAASNDPNAYVVQPGDTLLGISAKTGVPVATLMKNNGIDNPNAIRAGRALVLKKDAAAPAAQPTAAPTVQPAKQPTADPTAQPAKQPADAPAKPVKTTKTTKTPKTDKPAEPAVQPVVAQQQQPKPQDASVPLDQVPVAGTDKSLEDLLDGLSLSDARSQAEEKKETAAKAVEEAVQTAKNAAGDAAKAAPEGFKYYTVKEGENLYHLTARFKVPLAKLRELNDLPKTATKLDPGTVLLIPDVSAVAP